MIMVFIIKMNFCKLNDIHLCTSFSMTNVGGEINVGDKFSDIFYINTFVCRQRLKMSLTKNAAVHISTLFFLDSRTALSEGDLTKSQKSKNHFFSV